MKLKTFLKNNYKFPISKEEYVIFMTSDDEKIALMNFLFDINVN